MRLKEMKTIVEMDQGLRRWPDFGCQHKSATHPDLFCVYLTRAKPQSKFSMFDIWKVMHVKLKVKKARLTYHRRPPQRNQWRGSRSCWAGCRQTTGPYSEQQRISRFYPIFNFLIVNTEDFSRHSHTPELKMFNDEPSSVTERRRRLIRLCTINFTHPFCLDH